MRRGRDGLRVAARGSGTRKGGRNTPRLSANNSIRWSGLYRLCWNRIHLVEDPERFHFDGPRFFCSHLGLASTSPDFRRLPTPQSFASFGTKGYYCTPPTPVLETDKANQRPGACLCSSKMFETRSSNRRHQSATFRRQTPPSFALSRFQLLLRTPYSVVRFYLPSIDADH
jgi:hypothetical protein